MMADEALSKVRVMMRQSHYYCDDAWYSCPKADGGSANDLKGTDCDCGADKHNAEADIVYRALLDEVTRLREARDVWAQVLSGAEKLAHAYGGAPSGVFSLQLTGDVLAKLRGQVSP